MMRVYSAWGILRYGLMAAGLWGIYLVGSVVHDMANEGEATAAARRTGFFFPIADVRVGFVRIPYALNDVMDVIFSETPNGRKTGQVNLGFGLYSGKNPIKVYLRTTPQAHRLVLMADNETQVDAVDIDRKTGALHREWVSRHKRSADDALADLGVDSQHFIGHLSRKLLVSNSWIVER